MDFKKAKIKEKTIEEEILRVLKLIAPKKEEKSLENLLRNSKEKIKKTEEIIAEETEFILTEKKKQEKENILLKYQIKKDNENYTISINYQKNDEKEEVKIEAKDENEKIRYGITIRQPFADKNYLITIEKNSPTETYKIDYKIPLSHYWEQFQEQKQDFTNRVDKSLHIFPESMMGGILGFTYLGENFMARRADLVGDTAKMVDVHEAIHTPDEYETRRLTDWMLSRPKQKYIR